MYLLPIVRRETHLAARRGSYYRIRYLAGGAAGLAALTAISWATNVWQWSSSPGVALFTFTSVIALLSAIGSGLFLGVDALSREKREGTLGLLFLTELRGFDIVLGKLAAAGTAALSSFLTIFPIMALSLSLGGVTGTQFWRMSIALIVLLFWSLSIGLFISALLSREGFGIFAFILLLIAPSVWGLASIKLNGAISPLALHLNPLYPAFAAYELNLGPLPPPALMPILAIPQDEFGAGIRTSFVAAVGALVVAGWMLPRQVHQGRSFRWRQLVPRFPQVRRRHGMERHPVLWLSIRDRTPTVMMWAMIFGGLLLYRYDPLAELSPNLYGLSYPLLLHYVIKWSLAYQAGKVIAQEKMSGFLETLVTTPVGAGIILRSKRLALRRHFLAPVIITIGAHAWSIFQTMVADRPFSWAWVAFGSMVALFSDFFSISWVGLWQGLSAKTTSRAFLRTLVLGFMVPWLPFFLLTALVWFLIGQPIPGELGPALAAWGLLSAVIFRAMSGAYGMAQAHLQLRKRIAAG